MSDFDSIRNLPDYAGQMPGLASQTMAAGGAG